jgi:methylated-DNA-[protein]-cysteine S-methyltransferase
LVQRLSAYAEGRADTFLDVSLDLSHLTDFQREVVTLCRHIGYGKTLSYAELAARAGSPRAARAVGNVMRTNRFPLLVPCHRVVGSAGALGGYSAPDGLRMKERLLRMEAEGVEAV